MLEHDKKAQGLSEEGARRTSLVLLSGIKNKLVPPQFQKTKQGRLNKETIRITANAVIFTVRFRDYFRLFGESERKLLAAKANAIHSNSSFKKFMRRDDIQAICKYFSFSTFAKNTVISTKTVSGGLPLMDDLNAIDQSQNSLVLVVDGELVVKNKTLGTAVTARTHAYDSIHSRKTQILARLHTGSIVGTIKGFDLSETPLPWEVVSSTTVECLIIPFHYCFKLLPSVLLEDLKEEASMLLSHYMGRLSQLSTVEGSLHSRISLMRAKAVKKAHRRKLHQTQKSRLLSRPVPAGKPAMVATRPRRGSINRRRRPRRGTKLTKLNTYDDIATAVALTVAVPPSCALAVPEKIKSHNTMSQTSLALSTPSIENPRPGPKPSRTDFSLVVDLPPSSHRDSPPLQRDRESAPVTLPQNHNKLELTLPPTDTSRTIVYPDAAAYQNQPDDELLAVDSRKSLPLPRLPTTITVSSASSRTGMRGAAGNGVHPLMRSQAIRGMRDAETEMQQSARLMEQLHEYV